MNFLQICHSLAQETGTVSGTQPSTVTGQVGRLKKIVDAAAEAWRLIQLEHSTWRWMRREFLAPVTQGVSRYTGAGWSLDAFSRWDESPHAMTLYSVAAGVGDEAELREIGWDQWRRLYARGTQTQSRPIHWAISPTDEIALGPLPDQAYILNGEYWRSAQVLAADGDVPLCNPDFHMIVVWRGLLLMAESDEAITQMNTARVEYAGLMSSMTQLQLPQVSALACGPLA